MSVIVLRWRLWEFYRNQTLIMYFRKSKYRSFYLQLALFSKSLSLFFPDQFSQFIKKGRIIHECHVFPDLWTILYLNSYCNVCRRRHSHRLIAAIPDDLQFSTWPRPWYIPTYFSKIDPSSSQLASQSETT